MTGKRVVLIGSRVLAQKDLWRGGDSRDGESPDQLVELDHLAVAKGAPPGDLAVDAGRQLVEDLERLARRRRVRRRRHAAEPDDLDVEPVQEMQAIALCL